MKKKVGFFSERVINLLSLNIKPGSPIYIGSQNIDHIKRKHGHDFYYYGRYLGDIISNPDYVGIVPKDGSLEYIKEVSIEPNVKIKVAIRVSKNNMYFVRTFYNVNNHHIDAAVLRGTLFKVWHPNS